MLAFLVSHSLTNRPAFRRWGEALLGRAGFTWAYSLLSLVLLAAMIAALRAAPVIILWSQQPWMRWVPVLTMPLVCLLAVAGLSTPNPFSIGPGAAGYDAARPGILRLTRHPVLWAAALWAGAHLLPNGNVAAIIFFSPLLLLALAGPALLDAKRRRALGPDQWGRATALRFQGLAMVREVGWKRLAAAAIIYVALLHLHPWVIGVSPWP